MSSSFNPVEFGAHNAGSTPLGRSSGSGRYGELGGTGPNFSINEYGGKLELLLWFNLKDKIKTDYYYKFEKGDKGNIDLNEDFYSTGFVSSLSGKIPVREEGEAWNHKNKFSSWSDNGDYRGIINLSMSAKKDWTGEGDENFSVGIYADSECKELIYKTGTITIKDTSTSLGSWYTSKWNGELWSKKFPWRTPLTKSSNVALSSGHKPRYYTILGEWEANSKIPLRLFFDASESGKKIYWKFRKDYQYSWRAEDVSNKELGIENQYTTVIANDGTTTITVKPSDSLAGYYIGAEAYWDKHFTSPAAGKRIDRYFYPSHGRPRQENTGTPEFRNVLFRIAPQPRFWGHNQIKEGERFVVKGDLPNWNYKDQVAFRMSGTAKPGHDF